MYFITTKRMLEVCFSAHPNIQYRTVFHCPPFLPMLPESVTFYLHSSNFLLTFFLRHDIMDGDIYYVPFSWRQIRRVEGCDSGLLSVPHCWR